MKRAATFISLAVAIVLVMFPTFAAAQAKDEGALQNKYHVIQVESFDVQPGVSTRSPGSRVMAAVM